MKRSPPASQVTKMVNVRMPVDLEARARRIASEDDRTLTSLVLFAVRRLVQERESGRAA